MEVHIIFVGYLLLLIGLVGGVEVSVKEGERVTVTCPLGEGSSWTLDGVPLAVDSRVYPKGSHLVISRAIHDRDDGAYVCSIGDSVSEPTLVTVTWISENPLVKLIGKLPQSSGETLHLSCSVQGTQPISIQWFKNGDGLQSNGKIQLNGRELKVVNVNPLDNGVYRCLATNGADTVHSSNTIVTTVPGDQWAHIIDWPKDAVVKTGSSAYFDCVYQFADVIEWYFEQTGPLENSTHYSVLKNGTLIVHNSSKKDEGLYSCVGIRGESTEVPQVFSAFLHIAFIGELDERSLEPEGGLMRIVGDGGDLEIGCVPPPSLPSASVAWSAPALTSKSPTLRLNRLNKSFNYTCSAMNIAGKTSVTIQVVVTKPPQITANPIGLVVNEGNSATLQCSWMGNKRHTEVSWLKDGAILRGKQGSVLNLTSVESADRGMYACKVYTPPHAPVISSPAPLTVIEKLKFLPRPVNKVLELDSVKKIHCKAQGSTPPVVKWFKDGLDAFPDHVSDINGTLQFNPVHLEDKGKYTCVASNPQGVINATIDITVVVSPKFVILPKNPTDAYEGYPVIMDCVAEGDPKPAIHWDKNSLMDNFDNSRFQVLENGSLLIEEALISDEGKYGCTAGNSGGLKRYEVSLIVRGVEGYRMSDTADEDSVLSRTVAITLGAAGAYMVLVIGLMAYCRCRNQRKKQSTSQQPDSLLGEVEAGHSGEVKRCNGDLRHSDGDITAHSHCSDNSKKNYGKLPVCRDDLTNMMLLGRGMFGEVCLAQAKSLPPNDNVVMVKVLEETRDEEALQEFKRELDLFGRLDHSNMVKLVGLCQDRDPNYMVLQYTDWGDLKQMLLATKKDRKDRPKPPELTTAVMLSLCHQLSLAMEHISNHRLVHKDLAARNCLITSNLTLKVSLSALSKDTYSKEYFLHRNKLIPIRWQPYEVVSEDDYSTKSDVYSFGVTCWEVFSTGDTPMSQLTDKEVLSLLEASPLPWQLPFSCPMSLHQTLTQCWSRSPSARPNFSAIALQISQAMNP